MNIKSQEYINYANDMFKNQDIIKNFYFSKTNPFAKNEISNVYIGNLFNDMNFIVKETSDDLVFYNELLINNYINNENSIIPNLALFYGKLNQNNNTYLIFEYIKGITYEEFLLYNRNIDDHISVFFQILLVLGYLQEKYMFSHYDLHNKNILIVNYDEYINYQIPIKNKLYNIKTKILPVIIDFGLSTIYDFENCNFKSYNKFYLNFIEPISLLGFDVFKLVISSGYVFFKFPINNKDIKIFINDIILLFFENNPYNISNINDTKKSITDYMSSCIYNSDIYKKEVFYFIDLFLTKYKPVNIDISNRNILYPNININYDIENI